MFALSNKITLLGVGIIIFLVGLAYFGLTAITSADDRAISSSQTTGLTGPVQVESSTAVQAETTVDEDDALASQVSKAEELEPSTGDQEITILTEDNRSAGLQAALATAPLTKPVPAQRLLVKTSSRNKYVVHTCCWALAAFQIVTV